MAFQTKTFISIVASMINRMRAITTRITDYNVGSVARTLVEAPAQEIDELYQMLVYGLIEGIQTSVYTSFNFPPLPAVPASGLIRVTVAVQSTSVLIPTGSTLNTLDGSLSYLSTADATIPAGATYADVAVACSKVGIIGNIPAGTDFSPGVAVTGFVGAENLAPFVDGAELETPSAQKVRFNAYVQTLSRGTVASLLYALTNLTFLLDASGNVIERVKTANVDEPYKSDPAQPPGLVNAYVHNGVGSTSPALVTRAQAVIDGYIDTDGRRVPGYVASGVVMRVYPAGEQLLSVIGMLTIAANYSPADVVAQVTASVYTYITNIPVGQPYLAAVATDLVMQVPGVMNWMPVLPLPYVSAPYNVKIMPGEFQIIGWLAASSTQQTQTSGVLA
jgi:hypothetical protein